MPLDIFPSQQGEADADIASRPGFGPGLDPSFGESFGMALAATSRMGRDLRMQTVREQTVQNWITQYRAATGDNPINPEIAPSFIQARYYANLAAGYAAQKQAHPDLDVPPPPTVDDAHAAAIASEQQVAGQAGAMGARPQTLASRLGGVAGGLVAVGADPINLAAMAAGGPAEGAGILATALREGGIAAGSQAAIEATSFATNREIDPNYGLGNVAENISMAGVGGAALGGGIKALGAAWARLRAGRVSAPVEGAAVEPATAPESPSASPGRMSPDGIEIAGNGPTATLVNVRENSNLTVSIKPDAIYAGLASVPEASRGRGLAVQLYERAIALAASKGIPFRSDGSVTADAARVYDALARRGYDVRLDPAAVKNADGSYSARNDGGYVFEVGPKPPPPVPQYVQDAGNIVERQAHIADASPFKTAGPEGEIAHAGNYAEAEKAAVDGRAPEIPQDQFTTGMWRPGKVFAADGSQVGVRYEVVEANALVASQRADLSVNPDYPAELQPRDRTRAASAEQIAAIAGRLDPERLGPSPDAATGAPVVGPDNVVESGNGRVLAMRQAYDQGGADAYRDHLQSLGFDTTGMDRPVLIARRTTPLTDAERANFAIAANRSSTLRLSAPEQALADARLMDGPLLDKLSEGGLGTAANRPFVRAFLGRLPQSERGGLIDRHGTLSAEGERRVQAALLARAYGDPQVLSRILEDSDNGVKALAGSLTDVAGKWAAMRDAVSRGTIPAGMDVTPDLLDAFRLVAKARDTRVKLGDLVDQAHLFEAPSPATKALLKMMFRNEDLTQAASRQAAARALAGYAEEAAKNTNDARLFGEPLSQGDVLNTALAKVGREDLAPAAEQATLPLEARKAAADPVTDDAVLHQLDNLRDASQDGGKELMVPDPHGALDADGNPVMRSVNDLMNEADAEIKAAQEIEGCATGSNDEIEE